MTTEAKQRYITTYQSSYVDFPLFFVEKGHTYEDQKLKAALMAKGIVHFTDSSYDAIND